MFKKVIFRVFLLDNSADYEISKKYNIAFLNTISRNIFYAFLPRITLVNSISFFENVRKRSSLFHYFQNLNLIFLWLMWSGDFERNYQNNETKTDVVGEFDENRIAHQYCGTGTPALKT